MIAIFNTYLERDVQTELSVPMKMALRQRLTWGEFIVHLYHGLKPDYRRRCIVLADRFSLHPAPTNAYQRSIAALRSANRMIQHNEAAAIQDAINLNARITSAVTAATNQLKRGGKFNPRGR